MIFPAILLFFVLFFFSVWVWHHLRKRAILMRERLREKKQRKKEVNHQSEDE